MERLRCVATGRAIPTLLGLAAGQNLFHSYDCDLFLYNSTHSILQVIISPSAYLL